MRKALFIMASALLIAGCGGQKSETPQKKEMSLQLYSIRAEFKKAKEAGEDYSDILKKVAEAGFTSVEAASYNDGKLYGDEPQVYRKKVEDAGLVSLSSHVSCRLSPEELETGDLSKTMEFWDKCISAHKAAGVKYLVDPSIGRQASLKNLQVYCDMLNEVGRRCKEQGILFGYHNHSYEFEKVEDTVMYDYMLEHTDPELVFFQMDLYWAVYGHANPVDYFNKYPGRFKMFHVKDAREIGQSGMVGFDAIFRNAATAGLQDYVVEYEAFSTEDPYECLKVGVNYLNEADFVKQSYCK